MKLNRADRRRADHMKLDKCPRCGNFKVGVADSFVIPGVDGLVCFDCGVELAGKIIKETDKPIAVLATINNVKELHLVDSVYEVASIVGADDTWKPEINFEYGNPVLWFVRGTSKKSDRRVVRCGVLLKGIDKCSEFIRKIDFKSLSPDDSSSKESEHFILTPMRDVMGWQVCWRVTIKRTGKIVYIPLDGLKEGLMGAR